MHGKRLWSIVSVLLVLLVTATVTVSAASRNYTTHLKGKYELPVANDSNAQGQAIFHLSQDGASLHYKLNVANIDNIFMAHIHIGPADGTGPIGVWLYPSAPPAIPIPGRTEGTLAEGDITSANLVGPLAGKTLDALMAAIEGGNAYVNVHTNDFVAPPNTGPGDFPSGEIRGNLP